MSQGEAGGRGEAAGVRVEHRKASGDSGGDGEGHIVSPSQTAGVLWAAQKSLKLECRVWSQFTGVVGP